MIRFATMEDLPKVEEMVMTFISTSPYKDYAEKEVVHNLVVDLISCNGYQKVILVSDELDGFLAATTQPFFLGSMLIAVELGYWISPDKRGQGLGDVLRVAYEYWAQANGCSKCLMSCLDENVLKYYLKNDYKLFEYACAKDL